MHQNKLTGEKKSLLYIPKKYEKLFEEIENEAKKMNRGIGYFICEFYEKHKPL